MYCLVTTKSELEANLDHIVPAARTMLRRTGEHGQNCETIIKMMFSFVGDNGYLLLAFNDDTNDFEGFLFAVCVPTTEPWIEVIAISTKPKFATKVMIEVNDMLKSWAKSKGATKMVTVLTRKSINDKYPGEQFYEFFHKKLGYEVTGILLEAKL